MRDHRSWGAVLFAISFVMAYPTPVKAIAYRMTVKSVPEAGAKCVSTSSGPFVQGMRVFIWDCNTDLAQILDYDDQTKELKFGTNCVEIIGRGGGQDIIAVGRCSGSASQQWTMTTTKDNYQIVNANGLCLEISKGVIANGTPMGLSKCAPENPVQIWALFQASDAPTSQSSPVQSSSSGQISPAIMTIFERHKLMGTFAEDCKKDPSDNNQYIVHRIVSAGRVGRDQMKDRNVQAYTAVVDDAEELSENDVAMNIVIMESLNSQMKGWKMHLITRVDGDRIRLMQSGPLTGPYAGRTNIFAGKAANGAGETHWLTKCQ